MDNITFELANGKLVITCDVSPSSLAKARPSSTGKSKIVAGTGGYMRLSDGLSLSLNVITKA